MKFLLDKWYPKKWYLRIARGLLKLFYVGLNLAFMVLPFLGVISNAKTVLAIFWYISCVFMLDSTVDDFVYSKKQGKTTEAYISIPIIITLIVVFISYYYIRLPWLIIIAIYFISALMQEIIMISVKGKFIQWPLNKMAALPTTARLNAVGGMFYALALVIFFVSIYYKMLGIELIIGAIVLIFIIISISQTIPNWGEKHKAGAIAKFFVLLDFVSAFAIIIYLIYLIENTKLQNIVLTISAAAIGGLLTLSGVAWTIRRQDKIRKEEDKLKNKPIFDIYDYAGNEGQHTLRHITFNNSSDIFGTEDLEIFIKNSSHSFFTITSIIFNNMKLLPYSEKIIELSSNNIIHLMNIKLEKNNKCFIYVKDILENYYNYEIILNEVNEAIDIIEIK